jgi:glycosyltransferase involved in cell wall biosynthesis
MKILHFVNGRCNFESANGVEKTICYLARYQAKLGHSVNVFNMTEKPVLEVGDCVKVANFNPTLRGWRISSELKSAILDLAPDVIHFHSAYVPSNAAVARFAYSKKISYVTTPNGNLSPLLLKRKPWFKIPYKYIFELPMHQRAAFIHSINDKDDIRRYGVTIPMIIAPNGMELDDTPMPEDYFSLKHPEHSGKKRILFLGRLDVEQKGLDILIEGFAKLNPQKAVLILAGASWKDGYERLKESSIKKGVADRIVFWGGIFGDEKCSMFRHADFFVHTSRWEAGIPFSVLEALAAGLPVLATKGADPALRISKEGAGINPVMHINAIAEGLGEMLNLNNEQQCSMGSKGRDLVKNEFSWEKIAETICEGYKKHCLV